MNQTKLFVGFFTDFGFQKIKNISMKVLFLAVNLLFVSANILPGATPGILDTSFAGGGIQTTAIGDTAEIYATAVQPDGKIVVTGSCTASSTNQLVVARYNIDGSLDLTFNTTGQSFLSLDGGVVGYGIAVQDDGKIVVTGIVYSEGNYGIVARFLSNGSLDTVANGGSGFGTSGQGYITNYFSGDTCGYGIAIQPADQKIVITGQAGTSMFIARYTTAGELDSSITDGNIPFNSGVGYITFQQIVTAYCLARAVAIDADNNIVTVGQAHYNSGTQQDYILVKRYLQDGTVDSNFNAFTISPEPSEVNLPYAMYGLGFQSNNKIILAGTDGTNALVVRLDANGFLDSSFGTSSYFVTKFGADLAIANGIVVQDDDQIVIAGSATPAGQQFAIGRILANGSGFDTTFGTNGYTKTTILPAGYNCGANSLALQENGRFVMGGYTQNFSTTLFALTRYLGDAAPQGCMDVTYPSQIADSDIPGYVADPTDVGIGDGAWTQSLQVLSDNSVFVVTATSTGSNATQLVQLNSAGQVITNVFEIDAESPGNVIVDAQGRALVCGGGSDNSGWIGRYTLTAGEPAIIAPDATFNSNGSLLFNNHFSYFSRIGLLLNGSIVAIGNYSESNACGYVMYDADGNNPSQVVIDEFGYVTDLLIGNDNTIYVSVGLLEGYYLIYSSATQNYIINTGLFIDYYSNPYIAFDTNGNIIICAYEYSESSTGAIVLQKYNTSGDLLASGYIDGSTNLLNYIDIYQLQCDSQNRPVITGNGDNGFFVARCVLEEIETSFFYVLDTTFAPYAQAPGILTTVYDNNIFNYGESYTVGISPDGSILFGAYQQVGANNYLSVIGKIVGDPLAYQVARYPLPAGTGEIDTSFGIGGGLEVPGSLTIQPESIMTLSGTGDILIGINHETTSNIAGLMNDFSLNTTSFGVNQSDGTSGITPDLPVELVNIRRIITDNVGNLYVVGDNDATGAIVKLLPDGSEIIWENSSLGLSKVYSVVQQASGRILVAGFNGNYGVIIAINPNTGDLDTSFNQGAVSPSTPGSYFANQYTPITSLSIVDYSDQVLFAQADTNTQTIQIKRLLENGALDTTFPAGSPTFLLNQVDYGQIQMQQDVNGKIVVASLSGTVDAETGFTLSRYNADGSDDVINVLVAPSNIAYNSLFLKNILCLSDGTTLLLGYNTNGNSMVLAKLTAEFALDADFATGGILQTTVTSPVTMTNFYALGMSSAAPYNILVTADDGTNPYLVGIVSGLDAAVSAVNQSTNSWGPAGTLDVTYNPNHPDDRQAGFFGLGDEMPDGLPEGSVKAMVQMNNGSYFVLTDNGYEAYQSEATNSYLVKFDSTDSRDSSFSSSFVTITGMKQANAMMITQGGNLLVVGMGEYLNGMAVMLNTNDGSIISEFNFSYGSSFFYNFAVGQQPDGRIILAGADVNGKPALVGLNPFTGQVDPTFADNGIYTFADFGYFIPTMVIDADGNIYFMVNNDNQEAYTKKLSADGTNVLWTAGSTLSSINGIFDKIILDQNGNVVVATVIGITAADIVMNRYSYVNGTSLQGPLDITGLMTGISRPNINGLLIDQTDPTGNLIVIGSDGGNQPNNIPFVLRVLSDLSRLDSSFNAAPATYPGVQSIMLTAPASSAGSWAGGFIGANGKITVGGYATISGNKKTYLMRLYGDDFIPEYLPGVSAGVPGNLDRGFADNGYLDFADLSYYLNGKTPQVVLPLSDGNQYVAFTDGRLVRLTNGNVLDDTFGDSGFAQDQAPAGVTAMIMDANSCLVLVGTDQGSGWICRYASGDSGQFDSNFNDGLVSYFESVVFTSVVEQTLSRLVVAGQLNGTDGTLWAFTNSGAIDVTFNATQTPGYYIVGGTSMISSLIADEYDRLIFPYCSSYDLTQAYLARFNSAGEYDRNIFILDNLDESGNLRTCFDVYGHVVVAAQTTAGISVTPYVNGEEGFELFVDGITITGLTSPVLTGLIATADAKILVSGNQDTNDSDTNLMWIARVEFYSGEYQLDETFNPTDSGYGNLPGVMQFSFIDNNDVNPRNCNSIAMYPDGTISIVGMQNDDGTLISFMSRAFDYPYITQQAICEFAKPIGTNDQTLGVTNNVGNGIVFAAVGSSTQLQQSAQAIALQDDANILVACNSQKNSDSSSIIVMNMFNVDGLLNTQFNGDDPQAPCLAGQAIVLDAYDNQYVTDMLHITVGDVNTAILAGYATNNALNTSNILLMQYNLLFDLPTLDRTFGGFNGDPEGVAMGNNISQAFTLGRQSMGRIIVGGYQQGIESMMIGLLQAYTSNGLLDQSFGQSGSYLTDSQTAIYASAIDSQDRVVIAYGNSNGDLVISRILPDGSGVDTSFNAQSENAGSNVISYYPKVCDVSYSIALDQSGNIFIATAVWTEGLDGIALVQLDSDGSYVTNTLFSQSDFGELNNFTITKLLITAQADVPDQSLVLVGYEQPYASQNQIMVASFVQSAIPVDGIYSWVLDTDYFNQADTPGYIKYAVGSQYIQRTAGAIIHPDGRVIIAGSVDEAP